MKKIYIFTWPNCHGCINLKNTLTKESISFIDINVLSPENKKLWDDFKSQTNSDAVPQVFIQEEDNDEGLAYVPNKDWESIDEIVEIIKNTI